MCNAYFIKLNLFDKKEDYTPVKCEADLYRILAHQIVEQDLDRNGIPRRHQFWLAAPHLLILDFGDAPHEAEQVAFLIKEKLFPEGLVIRSGKKGAKLIYASPKLKEWNWELIRKAIENRLKQLVQNKSISKTFFERFKKIIDWGTLKNVKNGNPVRLVGLRWKGEEEGKFSGKLYFAHIARKIAVNEKEYFEEQKKYIEQYLLESKYEVLLKQAQAGSRDN
jgi:hypothetical protein